MSILDIKNVGYKYHSSNQNGFALRDINFQINSGEFIGILGPNGSGKTTLVKIIVKLLRNDSGEIFLNNINYNEFKGREFYKNIAFVPQKFNSIFPFTVYDIVLMGRTPYMNFSGYETEKDIIKVKEILELMEIDDLKDKAVLELSGGEMQRVIIARALVQDTPVIVLDEPNSHLDLKHQYFIFDLMKELNNKGKTIITISHDLNFALNYCKRIVFLKGGKIVFDGGAASCFNTDLINSIFDIQIKIAESEDERKILF